MLVANTYSRASDVFTFATMVWEVFNARDISTIKPDARIEDFEPCADISRDSVCFSCYYSFHIYPSWTECHCFHRNRMRLIPFTVRSMYFFKNGCCLIFAIFLICMQIFGIIQVLSFVRENTELPKPELCPHWLHSLVLDCRHSIPSKRPTAADILSILRQHLSGASPPKPFMWAFQTLITIQKKYKLLL